MLPRTIGSQSSRKVVVRAYNPDTDVDWIYNVSQADDMVIHVTVRPMVLQLLQMLQVMKDLQCIDFRCGYLVDSEQEPLDGVAYMVGDILECALGTQFGGIEIKVLNDLGAEIWNFKVCQTEIKYDAKRMHPFYTILKANFWVGPWSG